MTWRYTLTNKILIIDDEIIFCNALKNHLMQKGHDVTICNSYREFQKKINLHQFDLILLDLNLQDIHGFDLFKIAMEINPNLDVIMISAFLNDDNLSKAKELGICKYAKKNTQMFQVLDKIIETM